MMRTVLLLVVLLALWPGVGHAEERRPNALEVGAGVATCMTEARGLPPDREVVVQGNTQLVTLSEGGVAFATIGHQAADDSQPPLALTTLNVEITPYMRETMRYVAGCFGTTYWGKTVPWETTQPAHIPCRFEPQPDGLHQFCGDAPAEPGVGGWYECMLTREGDYIRSECRNGFTKWAQITPIGW